MRKFDCDSLNWLFSNSSCFLSCFAFALLFWNQFCYIVSLITTIGSGYLLQLWEGTSSSVQQADASQNYLACDWLGIVSRAPRLALLLNVVESTPLHHPRTLLGIVLRTGCHSIHCEDSWRILLQTVEDVVACMREDMEQAERTLAELAGELGMRKARACSSY